MTQGKNKIWWIVGSITALGVGLLFGHLIALSNKPKCNHKWKLIESENIWRGNQKNIRGWVKVYECEHCLKMRKEQVEVN